MVSSLTSEVVSGFPQQTLKTVYFAFHSGISVSTKSQINFHDNMESIQAGGFGWGGGKHGFPFHDYYHNEDVVTLLYSTNYNGGAEPLPPALDPFPLKPISEIRSRFGEELESPAAFGWLALYASPLVNGGAERPTPKPDVLRIDDHKRGTLKGQPLNLENFVFPGFKPRSFPLNSMPSINRATSSRPERSLSRNSLICSAVACTKCLLTLDFFMP